MSNSYYAPNQKVTGGCFHASWNSKDGAVYLKIMRQVANNPSKAGNFDGKNPINIKLSQDEMADIVRAVRTNGESKFYHKFDATVTSGSFRYWNIKSTEAGKPDRQGFGLSVKRGAAGAEVEIKVSLSLAGAERFSLFLQNALNHIFDAEYSEDIRKYKESQAKRGGAVQEKAAEPVAESAPASESTGQAEAPPADDGW